MQLGELHDQAWFPAIFRDGLTDALQSVLNLGAVYAPIAPRLGRAITASGAQRVVDLCSGGGGPWRWLQKSIGLQQGAAVEVWLTDKFPNLGALERARMASRGAIRYCDQPIDAARVPAELTGFRTMFTSIHHFPPAEAEAVLRDAVDARQGIGIFDTCTRHPLTIGVGGAGGGAADHAVSAAVPMVAAVLDVFDSGNSICVVVRWGGFVFAVVFRGGAAGDDAKNFRAWVCVGSWGGEQDSGGAACDVCRWLPYIS